MNHVAVVERVYTDANGVRRVVLSESHYRSNFDGGAAGTLHQIVDYRANNPDRYIRVPGVSVGSKGIGPIGNIDEISAEIIDDFSSYLSLYEEMMNKEISNLKENAAESSTTWSYHKKYGNEGAKEMLKKYKDFIIKAAEFYGIDGRAIAGVIRWEYENNWPSMIRDEYVYGYVQTFNSWWPFNGTGWGKMHHTTARNILVPGDEPTNRVLAIVLALAPSAIDLIAREMKRAVVAYKTYADVDIHDKPAILASLYNTGLKAKEGNFKDDPLGKAKQLGENRKKDPNKQPERQSGYIDVNDLPNIRIPPIPIYIPGIGLVTFPSVQNPALEMWEKEMGWWVDEHLNELEPYKTV